MRDEAGVAEATLETMVDAPAREGLDVSFNVVASPHSIGAELPIIESFFSPLLHLPEWLRRMSREEFVAGWTGVALELVPVSKPDAADVRTSAWRRSR